ncbi:Stk1 family PASTA domain-containing Ser/Thr kinase [Mollicutes bacterium LVI A0039]|nr:Stk1 family PASTA domain-containing Ser/Thr kinase [Mollicutes bacterium LVI A0039]
METKRIIDNRFEIIRKLGEGGTAQVFLAFDHKSEQNIALKVLKSDLVTEQKIRYFNREAQAISMLNNDNVIKIYDWGHDTLNNVHFIAQEYIEGMTIKEYLKLSSNLAVTEVVSLIEKILDGLAHAHLSGVIHKDIKGQNIMIDADKNIKITDFGIADILEDETTKTQSLMGTPQYVAPETLNRNISNAQTDIYSVGILMYELLCGHAPFTGDKPAVIMMKQINQPLPSIRMQRSDVPQALENIVIKATAKRLENRYMSSEEMLFDLATVFEPYNEDVPKLILENDLMDSDEIEQTIQIDSTLRIGNMKKEVDKTKKRQSQRRKIIIAMLIIAPLIILLILFLKPNTMEMPELIGMELESAKSSLVLAGVDDKLIFEVYESSDTIPKGQIILTDPVKGTELDEDDKITLTVSSGPEMEMIGTYIGQNGETIKTSLEEQGFGVEIIKDYNDAPLGQVYAQEPESGTEVEKGELITLYVSNGSAPVKIENLIGLTEDQAKTFVSDNALIGKYSYECSDAIDKDKVISQNPSSGAMLEVGGTIDFTISSGKCEPITISDTESEVVNRNTN